MRFLDILLGRSRPVKSRLEPLFAIATAHVTLATQLGLNPSRKAGVCFRPLSSSAFAEAGRNLRELLALSAQETQSRVETREDEYGYQWVLVEDPEFEDLVSTIHMVSKTLEEEGFRDQLLAAVFRFDEEQRPLYWIYNYKRGRFYPFAPTPDKQRDNALELRMRAVMERELPLESQLEHWYALWDIPF